MYVEGVVLSGEAKGGGRKIRNEFGARAAVAVAVGGVAEGAGSGSGSGHQNRLAIYSVVDIECPAKSVKVKPGPMSLINLRLLLRNYSVVRLVTSMYQWIQYGSGLEPVWLTG